MVSKGIKTAQIIAAALWTAGIGAVLLIMKYQDVLIPVLYGNTELSTEKVLPLSAIMSASLLAVLGIVSACIVCFSRASRTKLKAVIIALVYGLLTPVNAVVSWLLNTAYLNTRAQTFGGAFVAKYSILNSIINLFSLLFLAPAAILFLFSLGRYFDAERHCEAASKESKASE